MIEIPDLVKDDIVRAKRAKLIFLTIGERIGAVKKNLCNKALPFLF